jgi:Na+/glutamate symporter
MGIKAQRLGEPRSSVAIAISGAGIVLGMILGIYLADHLHT